MEPICKEDKIPNITIVEWNTVGLNSLDGHLALLFITGFVVLHVIQSSELVVFCIVTSIISKIVEDRLQLRFTIDIESTPYPLHT